MAEIKQDHEAEHTRSLNTHTRTGRVPVSKNAAITRMVDSKTSHFAAEFNAIKNNRDPIDTLGDFAISQLKKLMAEYCRKSPPNESQRLFIERGIADALIAKIGRVIDCKQLHFKIAEGSTEADVRQAIAVRFDRYLAGKYPQYNPSTGKLKPTHFTRDVKINGEIIHTAVRPPKSHPEKYTAISPYSVRHLKEVPLKKGEAVMLKKFRAPFAKVGIHDESSVKIIREYYGKITKPGVDKTALTRSIFDTIRSYAAKGDQEDLISLAESLANYKGK